MLRGGNARRADNGTQSQHKQCKQTERTDKDRDGGGKRHTDTRIRRRRHATRGNPRHHEGTGGNARQPEATA
eukprot:10555771-Lingulodinium_polyedra.AAC.1